MSKPSGTSLSPSPKRPPLRKATAIDREFDKATRWLDKMGFLPPPLEYTQLYAGKSPFPIVSYSRELFPLKPKPRGRRRPAPKAARA